MVGPRGFTTKIEKVDFRVGGVWKHIMRGPDGVNYPNASIFKEIVPHERITYAHGGGREEGPGATFVATWTFETVEGDKTRLTGRLVFPSKEARDFVVKEFGAIEGGKQTLERASEYVAFMQSKPFVLTREFKVPRATLWRAWTERECLIQWFGPKDLAITQATMDFRPGGLFHYCMRAPDGPERWGRFAYREIVPQTRLLWVNSFADQDGAIIAPPFPGMVWPREMLTEVSFTENAGKTTVTVKSLSVDATNEERNTFDRNHDSMRQGWGGTMQKLEDYLATA